MRSSGACGVGPGRLDALIASGRVPTPDAALPPRRPRRAGARPAARQRWPGATLGLSSQDVAGTRVDASTGRRTLYVQRTVEGSLSLTLRRPPGVDGRGARDRERYAVTYDAAGPPRRPHGARHRHLSRLVRPARAPAAGGRGCCRRRPGACAPTSRRRTSTSPTPRACAWRAPSSSRSAIPAAVHAGAAVAIAAALRRRLDARRRRARPHLRRRRAALRRRRLGRASRACSSARRCRARCSTRTSWPRRRGAWTGCGACAATAWRGLA